MRTTNLIQSYVSNNQINQQYHSDKAVKDFDINKELLNRTFIKPLPSNGKLVKTSIFDIPSEFRKDMMYDWRAFKHAVKGEANDHELGRLNDVGMKLGGLAIASYLFTKKQTPMTKIFEFIGLGTFFASMDLWPKLFIQLPAYLIHGVNVRQQYEDSFGRKKMFYQDHQFIPWDLYSDKEINKIGDRLNVPKDIPNRREFIQEKMRKIALQNNTLWMLTAGFATPLMSALLCNVLEAPVAKYLSKVKNQKADNLLANFTDEIKKYSFEKNEAALEEILTQNKGKQITPELFEAITSNLTDGLDYMNAQALNKDLALKFPTDSMYSISSESYDSVINLVKNAYKNLGLSSDELARLIPTKDEINVILSQRCINVGEFKDFSEHSKSIQYLLEQKINDFKSADPENPIGKKLDFAFNKLIHSKEIGADSDLFKVLKQNSATILTDDGAQLIKNISSVLNKFKAEKSVLEQYSFFKAAQAPETGLADAWNEVQDKLFKAMEFTPEEIKKGRIDREIAGEVLRNKVEAIVSNKDAYSSFMDTMEKAISSLHSKLAALDMTQDASINLYKSLVNSSFDGASDSLQALGLKNVVESLKGFGSNNATSSKALMLEFIEDRTLGIKSSFYRLLNMFDLYRKIATGSGVEHVLNEKMLREVKEECAELAKQTLLEAHTSDFAEKFPLRRNPSPVNPSDYSGLETEAGKVKNRYLGNVPASNMAEMSNDKGFFNAVMKLMFDGDVHSETLARIKDSPFIEDFRNYRRQVLSILGGDFNFAKPGHLVDGRVVESTSLTRFLLMGAASDEMAFKYFNQTFNSGKWFATFGKLGLGLAGVTLLSQFFFGRMKNPEVKKEVNVNA